MSPKNGAGFTGAKVPDFRAGAPPPTVRAGGREFPLVIKLPVQFLPRRRLPGARCSGGIRGRQQMPRGLKLAFRLEQILLVAPGRAAIRPPVEKGQMGDFIAAKFALGARRAGAGSLPGQGTAESRMFHRLILQCVGGYDAPRPAAP